MRFLAAVVAAFGLVFLTATPASAAPCQTVDGLGLVCVSTNDENVTVQVKSILTGDTLLSTSVPIPIEAPVTITVPGPTINVPGPTATQTITITPSRTTPTATVTRTASGSTSTQTITVTQSNTATKTQESTATATATATVTESRQAATPSATLSPTPTSIVIPPVDDKGRLPKFIPDNPKTVAATSGSLGIALGILLGIIGLFIAYRRGQIEGEKATLQEFLGIIRGEPQTGRHRLD